MKLNKTFPFVVDFIHFKYDLADLDQKTDFYEEILYRHFCKKQLYIRIKILKNSYLQYNEMQITRYENSFKGKKIFLLCDEARDFKVKQSKCKYQRIKIETKYQNEKKDLY